MSDEVVQAKMWKTRYENLSDALDKAKNEILSEKDIFNALEMLSNTLDKAKTEILLEKDIFNNLEELSVTLDKARTEIPERDIFISLIDSLMNYFKGRYEFFHNGFFHPDNIIYIGEAIARTLPAGVTNIFSQELKNIDLIIPQNKPQNKPQRLALSLQYPPEYVLKTLLNQVSLDLSVIQRAYDQRQVDRQQQVLRIADRLANQALDFAVRDENGNGLIQKTRVITYFEKTHAVRVIPYANVALVGVPYYMSDARDWMAIPHEVGHHVYWHGRYRGVPVANHLQRLFLGKPEWVHRWLEEIFADVYGYIVAGPLAIDSMQDMMFDNAPEALSVDDGKYPIPAIRPLIGEYVLAYFKTLGEMTKFPPALLNRLKSNWDSYRKHRGVLSDDFLEYESVLEKIVRILCMFLSDNNVKVIDPKRDNNDPLSKMWVSADKESNHVDSLNDLHKQFEKFKTKLVDPNLAIPAHWEETLPLSSADPWHMSILNPEEEKAETLAMAELRTTPMPVPVWLPIFAAGGWTQEGPETEPVIG